MTLYVASVWKTGGCEGAFRAVTFYMLLCLLFAVGIKLPFTPVGVFLPLHRADMEGVKIKGPLPPCHRLRAVLPSLICNIFLPIWLIWILINELIYEWLLFRAMLGVALGFLSSSYTSWNYQKTRLTQDSGTRWFCFVLGSTWGWICITVYAGFHPCVNTSLTQDTSCNYSIKKNTRKPNIFHYWKKPCSLYLSFA